MLYTRKFKLGASVALALIGVVTFTSANVNAETTSTTISSTLGSVISLLSSSGTVNINATPTGAGVQTIASDTVTVSTNATAGYTLQLGETTASDELVSGSDTIPAVAGTFAAPIAQTANSWGYRVDGAGGFGPGAPTAPVSNGAIGSATFAAVPATASPDTLKTTATTAANDTTTVWYGVAVDTTAASGTYTNSVTYTATAN